MMLDELKKYAQSQPLRFHTPAHKGLLHQCDITELGFSDNLQHPKGIILQAEQRACAYFGTHSTFLLTNGSTQGIFAAVCSLKKGKLLIQKNSHSSVYNACDFAKLEPVIVPDFAQMVAQAAREDIVGALVTSPDYFGNICDVARLRHALGDKTLIVDESHGAHLYAKCINLGSARHGDIVIHGAHKTLPALTQAAFMSANAQYAPKIRRALRALYSTSPSYLLMASLDFAIDYVCTHEQHYDELLVAVQELRQNVHCQKNDDPLRLVVDTRAYNACGLALNELLQKHNVFAELATNEAVVFICSIVDSVQDIKKLQGIIQQLLPLCPKYEPKLEFEGTLVQAVPFLDVCDMDTQLVSLEQAVGRICAREMGIFPPCVPLAVRGQRISTQLVEYLQGREDVFGLDDGQAEVCIE